LVLGGALTFEMLRRSSETDAEMEPTQVGFKNKLDEMEGRRTTARILAGVGGGLVLVGGALLIVDIASGEPERTASLGFSVSPAGAGATLGGQF
jgi:hypothetical protein